MKISVCMIVKNEEKNLDACLASLQGIADEIIIADTGSTDATKQIAARYTNKIYDFAWTGSFSDARNFAFSKAQMDYIYSADADERLDEENRQKFMVLKETLLPEIEIVQMYYCNQLTNNTIYSFDKEYRPKLYKRIRQFVWEERIHEAVNLSPVIYDSDIAIGHFPAAAHGDRDLAAFEQMLDNHEELSERLLTIYMKELFIVGKEQHFSHALPYFVHLADDEKYADNPDMIKRICCIAARGYRYQKDIANFFKYALRVTASDGCSEMCYEIGAYYAEQADYNEAAMWFYNAVFETEALLALSYKQELSLEKLAWCHEMVGDHETAKQYYAQAKEISRI